MRKLYIADPYVGQKYHTINNTKDIFMEITDLTEPNGDSWVGFKNIESGQTYSCRLEAFLARYRPVAD